MKMTSHAALLLTHLSRIEPSTELSKSGTFYTCTLLVNQRLWVSHAQQQVCSSAVQWVMCSHHIWRLASIGEAITINIARCMHIRFSRHTKVPVLCRRSRMMKMGVHLWKLFSQILEGEYLLRHGIDLLHHIRPKEVSKTMDRSDHGHIKAADRTKDSRELAFYTSQLRPLSRQVFW